jgi:hypothetical protein
MGRQPTDASLYIAFISKYSTPVPFNAIQAQIQVIYMSVKHFKNLQQIDYATDHGNSYADREINFPNFLRKISRTYLPGFAARRQ